MLENYCKPEDLLGSEGLFSELKKRLINRVLESEMANYALFLTELCDQILQVPHPEPSGTDTAQNRYAFERGVTHKAADGSSSSGRIDLYKAGCFVLETKQGTFAKAKEVGTVLDAVRQGMPLSAKEKAIHDAGLVSILKQIYDELDAAVLEAYGWGKCGVGNAECGREEAMADVLARGGAAAEALEQDLLTRLVALNHARAAEEQRGLVRWLRPDYQNPTGHAAAAEDAQSLPGTETLAAPKPRAAETAASIWPDGIPAQFAAVHKRIASHGPDAEAIAASFGKKSAKRSQQVAEILETLRGLGTLNLED